MALRSMNAHRLRTFLTMLGIIIGTASVVCVVALGQGSQKQILEQISDLGTNTLYISPGKGFGDLKAALITTLNLADATEIAKLPYVLAATPSSSTSSTIRVEDKEVSVSVSGSAQIISLPATASCSKAAFSISATSTIWRRWRWSMKPPGRRSFLTKRVRSSARLSF